MVTTTLAMHENEFERSAAVTIGSFKSTEGRLVPQDWQVRPLLSVVRVANGQVDPRETPFCSMVLVAPDHVESGTGRLLAQVTAEEQHAISGKYRFSTGDIVYSKIRPYLRKAILANFDGLCSADMYPLKPTPGVSPGYVFAVILGEHFSRYAETVSVRSGMPKINREELSGYQIAIPATLREQGAIAEALSNTDELIESLEALIDKKRAIKQGAMQDLLSGTRRLPGFSGEWESRRLGDTAQLKARIGWQGLTTAEYQPVGEYCLVTGTEFGNGRILWEGCHYVEESRYSQDRNIQLRLGDVLVTKDGTIGKVAYVEVLPQPATLNSGIFVIRPINGAFDPQFFHYLLCSSAFALFLDQLSAGSTINHLYQKDFVNFLYRVPPTVQEQTQIAEVLSAIDSNITVLEHKLAKVRQIKQGMMQELLTGKVRLV